jgi:hypothetical protein
MINYYVSVFEENKKLEMNRSTSSHLYGYKIRWPHSPECKKAYRLGHPINVPDNSLAFIFRRKSPKLWDVAVFLPPVYSDSSISWMYFTDESRIDMRVPVRPVRPVSFSSLEVSCSYFPLWEEVNSSAYEMRQGSVFEGSDLSELISFISKHPYLKFSGWNSYDNFGHWPSCEHRGHEELLELLIKSTL